MERHALASHDTNAKAIVKRYMLWSMGAGVIPIPGIDLATITGVQLKMLSELAKEYGVPFREDRGKAVISGLIGGVGSGVLAYGVVGSVLKIIPIFGSLLGAASVPITAGAATYALGNVFLQHFASGGTFLNFDPAEVRDHFAEHLEEGRRVAADAAGEARRGGTPIKAPAV
jgi:uncharacterized protein (DUF697 family)